MEYSTTIVNSFILLVVSTVVSMFILRTAKPSWVTKPDARDSEVDTAKVVMYSVSGSVIFTLCITALSLQVDKASAKKEKTVVAEVAKATQPSAEAF